MANETRLYLKTILSAAGISYSPILSTGQLKRLAVARRLMVDVDDLAATVTTITESEKGDTGDAGPQGPQGSIGSDGSAGTNGSDGSDGNTVLNGSGAPGSGLGVDSDFYIDTTADEIYGPKLSGSWGSGTSIVGPQGPTGGSGSGGSQIDVGPLVVSGTIDSIVVFGSLTT